MIEIHAKEEGDYTITSHSTKDLIGYIHENNFTLFDLNINKIESDDDSDYNYQFKITLYRQANSSFILIVTTAQKFEQGDFSITVYGPTTVSIRSQSKFSFFLNFSLKIENIDDTGPIIRFNYSSELNNKSQKHTGFNCRQLDYYYEALEINVNTSGFYMFSSESRFDTYGYLYEHEFNPYNSIDTSLAQSDHTCNDDQLQILAYLNFNITYILIVTTFYAHEQGPFSVFIEGSDKIKIKQMSMYYTNITFNLIL